MTLIDTVVIGGGQAGLAMSLSLSRRGIEHVVLERGRVAERWRSERWASLHLLTPRWLSRVAGHPGAASADPNGFMGRDEVVDYLEGFAAVHAVPVRTGVSVRSVTRSGRGFHIGTDSTSWRAHHVVIATGESQHAKVPAFGRALAPDLHQVVPTRYERPETLPPGGVLVVGASATGIQLAEEIHASGRPVTVSVGRHTRLPRRYRGRDILEWLHAMGLLAERSTDVADLRASRSQPSMQLTGGAPPRTLDLGVLYRAGVRLVGRTVAAEGRLVRLADDLVESVAASEFKLARLRIRIDAWARRQGVEAEDPDPFQPVDVAAAPTTLDLGREGIRTVVWATGFGRSYPWLRMPVLDARGDIRHHEGVTSAPGLYVLGLNFLRTRASSFLTGVASDAEAIADHLVKRRARVLHRDRTAVA